MRKWALRCSLASKRAGKDSWFMCWTAIGPAHTLDPDKREVFDSKQAAMQSPAFTFPLSFFEPVEIESARAAGKGES